MNIAFLGLNSDLVNINDQEEIINFFKKNILKLGKYASLISYFNNSFDSIRDVFRRGVNWERKRGVTYLLIFIFWPKFYT